MISTDEKTSDRRQYAQSVGRQSLEWYETAYLSEMQAHACRHVPCHDPSNGEVLWDIPDCSEAIIDSMLRSSRLAQKSWERVAAAERRDRLLQCAEAVEICAKELAVVLALETGKALRTECVGEVKLCADIFKYFAGLVHEIKGKSIQASPELLGFTTRHPWGVVAGIIPWNVPLMFTAYKIAASIAVGNGVVIKMPEQATASLSMILKAILPHLPDGIVHAVSGRGKTAGQYLVDHDEVDKISFTGSVATGREIRKGAAERMKSVSLELGGKSPMILLEDCDIDSAVDGIIGSMRFTRAGQSCTAGSRIYVPKNQLEDYADITGSRLDELIIGDALDLRSDCGPVVSARQKDKIDSYLSAAERDQLDVRPFGDMGGCVDSASGYYVRPHLIISPDHDHPVVQDEIFGPVAVMIGYSDLDEAIAYANDTSYGLSASVWGRDITACMQCAGRFRCGIVQVNQNAVMLPGFSYGGVGISGVGKESSLEAMLENYMYEKTNIVNFGTSSR